MCLRSDSTSDESENGYLETFNILLKAFDKGHWTENKDQIAYLKNTIIKMISNMESKILLEKFESQDLVI